MQDPAVNPQPGEVPAPKGGRGRPHISAEGDWRRRPRPGALGKKPAAQPLSDIDDRLWLTPKKAWTALDISKNTFWRRVEDGSIPVRRLGPGIVRVSRHWVETGREQEGGS